MTPESLQRIQDLRLRIVQSDEAARSGNHDLARKLMPSDDEIVEALKAARDDRAAAMAKKADKAQTKAATEAFKTMDLNELFS